MSGSDLLVLSEDYFGFPISKALYHDVETLLAGFETGLEDKTNKLLSNVILSLLDESMEVFFIKPLSLVGSDPMGEKIVLAGVNSVKKVIGFLVKSLSGRLSAQELKSLVLYLSEMFYVVQAEGQDPCAYLATPIPVYMNDEFEVAIQQLAESKNKEHKAELIQAFSEITHYSIAIFFRRPIELLSLNMVLRKAAKVAIETTETAIHKIIKKVFDLMNVEQALVVANYISELRKPASSLKRLQPDGEV